MPLYRYRAEAQDKSGHYRSGTIEAASEEEARLTLEERERDRAAFRLSPEREEELLAEYGAASLEDLPSPAPASASEEEKAEFRRLRVRDRSHLNLHRQELPYKVVKLEAVAGEEA